MVIRVAAEEEGEALTLHRLATEEGLEDGTCRKRRGRCISRKRVAYVVKKGVL
jgi:hypothetical protein